MWPPWVLDEVDPHSGGLDLRNNRWGLLSLLLLLLLLTPCNALPFCIHCIFSNNLQQLA